MTGDDLEVFWIGVVMGIAERVNVPLGPADRARRFLEDVDTLRSIHEPLCARLDPGVATSRQDQRQPAAVQLQARRHKYVGVLNGLHQAWLRRNEMGVLVPPA